MIKGTNNFCALVAKLCGKDCSQFVIDQLDQLDQQSTLIKSLSLRPGRRPRSAPTFQAPPAQLGRVMMVVVITMIMMMVLVITMITMIAVNRVDFQSFPLMNN